MFDLPVQFDRALNSAPQGRELAERVMQELRSADRVRIDFAGVERMTPSFANAFVMLLMDDHLEQVVMENRSPNVQAAIARSRSRYLQGIRLSIQRPVPA